MRGLALARHLAGPTSPLGRRGLLDGPTLSRTPLGRGLPRPSLLGGTATLGRSLPRRCLLGGTTALCSLPRRSPLHCLLGGGTALGGPLGRLSRRRALDCFLCRGPLFSGLSGRSPSFCGYCHRCTSLGAWSLNRGEACATPRSTAQRRAHCRTGFTVKYDDRRANGDAIDFSTSLQAVLIPRPVSLDGCATTRGQARTDERSDTVALRATHHCVAAHITLPHNSGIHILLL